MKALLIIGLLIALSMAYNGHTPRSEQSCADKKVVGVFWDGQKCDVCSNANCYCDTYLGCDSCADGFSLYTITEDNNSRAKCYKCPDNVKSCCFHGIGTDYKLTASETDEHIANVYLVSRALSCYTSKDMRSNMYGEQKRYGGYCHYVEGCLDYNNYGQCHECIENYYMTKNTYTSVGTCKKCEVKNCSKCSSYSQCDTCMPGFFMETNVNRYLFKVQSEIPASKCTPCAENCLCDGKITLGLDLPRTCTACISDRYFPTYGEDGKTIIHCVKQCDNECEKCILDDEGTNTKCLKCYAMHDGKYYATEVNKESKCVECPAFCSACRLVDGEPTCIKNMCFNGYYEVQNDQGRITCTSCESSQQNIRHVLRCKATGVPGKIEATQCGENFNDQSLTWQQISSDATHTNDISKFYLVGTGVNTKCVENVNYCKKIDTSVAGSQEAKCTECYEDKGYQLFAESKICLKCNIYNGCLQCTTNGGTTAAQCTECRKGQDTSVYGDFVDTYTLKDDRCVACNNGCKQCDTAGHQKCDGPSFCQSGYYFKTDGSKECSRCDVKNCANCTNGKDCGLCFPGFSLWKNSKSTNPTEEDHKCVACHPWCLSCDAEKSGANRRQCNECRPGYYIQDGVCHKPRKMCQIYSTTGGGCVHCMYGYRVVNGYCHRSFAADQGYVNVEYGCATDHRVRDDGYLLNRDEFSDWLPPLSGSVLSISAILFAVILAII